MTRRRTVLATALAAVLCLATALAGPVCATQGPAAPLPAAQVQACRELQGRLAGAWSLVSWQRAFQDGRRVDLQGAQPKGSLVIDPDGHFALVIAPADQSRTSPDPGAAAQQGAATAFGSISLSAVTTATVSIWFHADFASATPGIASASSSPMRIALADDTVELANPGPYGQSTRMVWRRAPAP